MQTRHWAHWAAVVLTTTLCGGADVHGHVRLFMTAGSPAQTVPGGNTLVTMPAGSTATVRVWLQDDTQAQLLNGLQVIIRWTAEPQAQATGSVTYRNLPAPPGQNGRSLFIDEGRADYVFAGAADNPVTYLEMAPPAAAPGIGWIASLQSLHAGVHVNGIRYLGEFQITATENAAGLHELAFVQLGAAPAGGTFMLRDGGIQQFVIDEIQNLTISVISGAGMADDCADAPLFSDGVIPFDMNAASSDGPGISVGLCESRRNAPKNARSEPRNDVWVRYIATCPGWLTASTCNDADLDTRIAVYGPGSGCPPSAEDLIACNDDAKGCAGGTSVLETLVVTGQDYLVQVSSPAKSKGSGYLTLTCPPSCTPGLPFDDPLTRLECGAQDCEQVYCTPEHICITQLAPPGTVCDDENGCTFDDVCDAQGVCAGGAMICPDPPGPCLIGHCEEGPSGLVCVYDEHMHGMPCTPGPAGDAVCASAGFAEAYCDPQSATCVCQDTPCAPEVPGDGADVRLFMAREGEACDAPSEGPVEITLQPGETARIGVYVRDMLQDQQVHACWVAIYRPWALPHAQGQVTYVPQSIGVDEAREDFIFAGHGVASEYYEQSAGYWGIGWSSMLEEDGLGIYIVGTRYVGEFAYQAGPDACGGFKLHFVYPDFGLATFFIGPNLDYSL